MYEHICVIKCQPMLVAQALTIGEAVTKYLSEELGHGVEFRVEPYATHFPNMPDVHADLTVLEEYQTHYSGWRFVQEGVVEVMSNHLVNGSKVLFTWHLAKGMYHIVGEETGSNWR